MTGLKHWRLQRKLSQTQLGELIGVAPSKINCYEHGKVCPLTDRWIALSDALAVPIDDLLKSYPDDVAVRIPRRTGRAICNIIGVYASVRGLVLHELGTLLGMTAEGARQLLSKTVPSEAHLHTLAHAEDLTIEEFCARYALRGEEP